MKISHTLSDSIDIFYLPANASPARKLIALWVYRKLSVWFRRSQNFVSTLWGL